MLTELLYYNINKSLTNSQVFLLRRRAYRTYFVLVIVSKNSQLTKQMIYKILFKYIFHKLNLYII